MRVAALYVEPDGVYAGLPDVDLWDESRDARLYDGPWPVVAHPPCARWSKLAYPIAAAGGPAVGDDGGCFAAALESVRRFGGVLEHPAASTAWRMFGLPRATRGRWNADMFDSGAATEVSQIAYGHRAQKRTWLYCVGLEPPALDWSEPPALIRCDWMNGTGPERAATPPAFRDVLLEMARSVRREAA